MANIRDIVGRMHEAATRLGVCPLFTGRESTPEEIFSLFFTPQGLEFCLGHDFPGMDLWRELRAFGAEDFGIFIDAGDITLRNPWRAALVGDTRAAVICDRLDKATHRAPHVHLLQGASADIRATNWAMCFVKSAPGCRVTADASDHARVIWPGPVTAGATDSPAPTK